MKRILSIFLCVAMLMSAAAVSVVAEEEENVYWGEYEDQVTATNKMSFKTDKESYAPGDEVVITATMDSIWGDPALVDDIEGYEGSVLPGAYGMSLIASTIIFPLDTFTPLAGKDLLSSSTITNIETGSVVKTPLADAKKGGFYNFQVSSPNYPFNDDEDAYVFFTGSGDLFNYRLTVNADAKPGTYKLPVGPYVITDYETGADKGFLPEFEFFDQWYAWIGNSDSLLKDRAMDYGAGLVSVDDPAYLTNVAYIEITIEGEGGEITPPPVPDDPMSFDFGIADPDALYVKGDIVEINLTVSNSEGVDADALNTNFTFDPTALKLVDVTTPIADLALDEIDYAAVNKIGSYADLGKLANLDVFFTGSGSSEEDGVVLTLKFEVLATANGAEAVVTGHSAGLDVDFPNVAIKLAENHTHAFEEKTTPADCKNAGWTDTVCACGLSYRTAETPALGCKPSSDPDKIATVPPTCTTEGYTNYYCDVCGALARTDKTPALGHDLKTVKNEVSCTMDGYEMQVCQREGCKYESEKTNVVPMLAHKNPDGSEAWYVAEKGFSDKQKELYGDDVYVLPTTNSKGYKGKTCALCESEWLYEELAILAVLTGDVNMNGAINLTDVTVLMQHIAKWDNLYASLENSDANFDGRVNLIDATRILQHIAWGIELKPDNIVG